MPTKASYHVLTWLVCFFDRLHSVIGGHSVKPRILPAQLVRMQQVQRHQHAKTSVGAMFLVAGPDTALDRW
jgi:hypothetical protein